MPRLQAKVEGKGNGIKTVLVNMVDVARALSRPPTYVTKFFGCELGAQTNADVKNERFVNKFNYLILNICKRSEYFVAILLKLIVH